jgi:hypothetical protein
MRSEGSTSAELDATGLGLDPAGCGTLGNTMPLVARRHTQHGNDDLRKLGRGVHHRLCDRAEARAGFFHRMENVQQAEVDSGKRGGVPTEVADKVKALEREVRELRQANEILRKASAYFAQAELDRPFRR